MSKEIENDYRYEVTVRSCCPGLRDGTGRQERVARAPPAREQGDKELQKTVRQGHLAVRPDPMSGACLWRDDATKGGGDLREWLLLDPTSGHMRHMGADARLHGPHECVCLC